MQVNSGISWNLLPLLDMKVIHSCCSCFSVWLKSFPFFLGIDLENIVYYKDDTHYFVMTAKKKSLLEKGVIKEVSTTRLLY